MDISFTKMHGAGNAYIYIDCLGENKIRNPAALAVSMSRQHFGVGADGMVLILPSAEYDAKMRMYNADGSEGKMCGNALRCIGTYLYERGYTKKTSLKIETAAGLRRLWLKVKDGRVLSALADMGRASFFTPDIPVLATPDKDGFVNVTGILGASCRATCVSMGNPHAVFFSDDPDKAEITRAGEQIEKNPIFPEGVNSEFARVTHGEIYVRTYERGTGETLACGTGACACAAAAALHGFIPFDTPVKIKMRGGEFEATVKKNFRVFLLGKTETVFDGTYFAAEDMYGKNK